MLHIKTGALMVVGLAILATTSQATLYNVPGTADPWLAGVASGSFDPTDGSGHLGEPPDVAPNQSPVQVTDAGVLTPGNIITWSATGTVGHPGDTSGPNGNSSVIAIRTWGTQNGIPDINPTPINALLGVFIGTAPTVFFMGESGSITVPAGATGFYLGTMDAYGWANNIGSFDVEINVVPEPSTIIAGALLLVPFGVSSLRLLRKNRA